MISVLTPLALCTDCSCFLATQLQYYHSTGPTLLSLKMTPTLYTVASLTQGHLSPPFLFSGKIPVRLEPPSSITSTFHKFCAHSYPLCFPKKKSGGKACTLTEPDTRGSLEPIFSSPKSQTVAW